MATTFKGAQKEFRSKKAPTGAGGTSFSMQYQYDVLGTVELLIGTDFHVYAPYQDEPQEFAVYSEVTNSIFGTFVALVCAVGTAALTGATNAVIGSAVATSAIKMSAKAKGNKQESFQAPMVSKGAVVGASRQSAPRALVGQKAAGKAIVKFGASSFVKSTASPELSYTSSNGVAIIPEAAIPLGVLT